MSSGETITVLLVGGVLFLMWFNSMIRRRNFQRMMQEQAMAQMSRMPSPFGFFGGGNPQYGNYNPHHQGVGSSIGILLAIAGVTVYGLAQFKDNFPEPESAGRDDPVTSEMSANHGVDQQGNAEGEVDWRNTANSYSNESQSYLDGHSNVTITEETNETLPNVEQNIEEGQTYPQFDQEIPHFGKQLFASSNEENANEKLLQVLDIYPDAPLLILMETGENGNVKYKGIVGDFPNRNSAQNAYPKLNKLYKGSFPVDISNIHLLEN